jgi:hypothetical protein
MSGVVYLLCAVTSLVCAVLLLRGFWKNGVKLLLWSGFCFVGLTLDNVFLFLDVIVFPEIDLSLWRVLPGVIGLMLLLHGLVWDAT